MNDCEKYSLLSIEKFINELDDMVVVIGDCSLIARNHKNSDISLRVYRAEWHVRGLIYHCRNI